MFGRPLAGYGMGIAKRNLMARKRKNMETFSPEFAQYWLDDAAVASEGAAAPLPGDDASSSSQREALEALAERVNAARSIV